MLSRHAQGSRADLCDRHGRLGGRHGGRPPGRTGCHSRAATAQPPPSPDLPPRPARHPPTPPPTHRAEPRRAGVATPGRQPFRVERQLPLASTARVEHMLPRVERELPAQPTVALACTASDAQPPETAQANSRPLGQQFARARQASAPAPSPQPGPSTPPTPQPPAVSVDSSTDGHRRGTPSPPLHFTSRALRLHQQSGDSCAMGSHVTACRPIPPTRPTHLTTPQATAHRPPAS